MRSKCKILNVLAQRNFVYPINKVWFCFIINTNKSCFFFSSLCILLSVVGPVDAFSVRCKQHTIMLDTDGTSFGFVIRGGMYPERRKCRPLTVTHIRPGGSADRWVGVHGTTSCNMLVQICKTHLCAVLFELF